MPKRDRSLKLAYIRKLCEASEAEGNEAQVAEARTTPFPWEMCDRNLDDAPAANGCADEREDGRGSRRVADQRCEIVPQFAAHQTERRVRIPKPVSCEQRYREPDEE